MFVEAIKSTRQRGKCVTRFPIDVVVRDINVVEMPYGIRNWNLSQCLCRSFNVLSEVAFRLCSLVGSDDQYVLDLIGSG